MDNTMENLTNKKINSDDVINYLNTLTPAAYVAIIAKTCDGSLNNSSNNLLGIDFESCQIIKRTKNIINGGRL